MKHCVNHPRQKAESLCMGCGHWVCEACTRKIRDIAYCLKCAQEVGDEYAKLKDQHDLDDSLPGALMSDALEESTKGRRARKESRTEVKPATVNALKGVPLKGIVAGKGPRVTAKIVDLALFLVVLVCGAGAAGFLYWTRIGLPDQESGLILGGAAGFLLGFVLRWILLAAACATPGKMAVHLRVVRHNGKFIGAGTALKRAVVETVEMIIPFIPIISLARVHPERKQGSIVDALTGTQVVDAGAWEDRARKLVSEDAGKRKKARPGVRPGPVREA